MPTASHSFATRLSSLRAEQRLSKTALAKKIGVSTTCVWNWEEGNTEPRADNLGALSRALNVSADYLGLGKPQFSQTASALDTESFEENLTLPDVINRAKSQIATLAGTDPANVKITIDY